MSTWPKLEGCSQLLHPDMKNPISLMGVFFFVILRLVDVFLRISKVFWSETINLFIYHCVCIGMDGFLDRLRSKFKKQGFTSGYQTCYWLLFVLLCSVNFDQYLVYYTTRTRYFGILLSQHQQQC